MKIKEFNATDINGFLNFSLKFKDDLTFVTGINGTGKTSALNFIIALVFPRLDYLATSIFKEVNLKIEHEQKTYTLTAKKIKEDTILTCTAFKEESFTIGQPLPFDDAPDRYTNNSIEEYYKRILFENRNHPIIQFIANLPSPIYLGLERRSLSIDTDERHHASTRYRRWKSHGNIFSRSIGQSIHEALIFARETFQSNRKKEVQLNEKIRKDLVLGLLEFEPIKLADNLAEPTREERERIEEARENLGKLPGIFNVDQKIISKKTEPLFKFFDEQQKVFEKSSSGDDENFERMRALMEWSFNKTYLSKIDSLSKLLSEYDEESKKIFERTDEFLKTVNYFLEDSAKKLHFNGFGDLFFTLHENPEEAERDLRTLSSGEVQLIVILIHLYFNPEVGKANVFIIDEPELSLHLHWQEKFVDSVTSATDNTQFIMATHSPTIILDKTSHCIEILAK